MQDVYVKLYSGLSWQEEAFNKTTLFTNKLEKNLRYKLVKCCIWSIVFYSLDT